MMSESDLHQDSERQFQAERRLESFGLRPTGMSDSELSEAVTALLIVQNARLNRVRHYCESIGIKLSA